MEATYLPAVIRMFGRSAAVVAGRSRAADRSRLGDACCGTRLQRTPREDEERATRWASARPGSTRGTVSFIGLHSRRAEALDWAAIADECSARAAEGRVILHVVVRVTALGR